MEKTRIIKLFGVGGAGVSVAGVLEAKHPGRWDVYAVDSHKSMLSCLKNESHRILIGCDTARGLGTGGYVERGRKALLENIDDFKAAARGVDIVFIIAGLGGGIGTGAVPLIADICREQGAFTIVFVTIPFSFEGKRRAQAFENTFELAGHSDVFVSLDLDSLVDTAEVDEYLSGGARDSVLFWSEVDQKVCRQVEKAYRTWGMMHVVDYI